MFTAAKGVLGFWTAPAGVRTIETSVYSTAFNYKDATHLRVVSDSINQFTSKLNALMYIDYRIAMAAAISGIAYVGAYIFPLVLVSIAAASIASYNLGIRGPIHLEYRDALNELIKVYQWTMTAGSANYWYKLAVPQLQDLISTLGPWVTAKTIATWTHDDLRPARLSLESRRSDIPVDFENRLTSLAAGEQMKNLPYRLYGETASATLSEFLRELLAKAVPAISQAVSRQP
ncbi:hypothetical protein [Legionella sp. CNM-4043-24]|uniref:hypothetical protein n=1 Tax=Legionella sp. CNM-4043-24 TaxID=3421646 RepID=UPI00403B0D40